MHRWTSLLLGLLLAAALTTVLIRAPRNGISEARPAASTPARESPADASAVPAQPASSAETETQHSDAAPPAPLEAPLSLPASAPKSVTFGVVLVRYAGAEGAPRNARSKSEAKNLAESLVPEAQKDFSSAVAHGDRGSVSDAGRLPMDVLEPGLEYALFTLRPGQVHAEPIDTPKGYWIVKRIK